MENIRNAMDKLVCRLDKAKRIVEIVNKGCKTVISFYDNGRVEIINYPDKTA